ncbi:DUF1295 domain-containing protein [Xanthovirga aplysinae]|uniref:DUF1295 domain-containing protein n=1 Tax=Xanthovirga aplysinae TaxID=2529853 RepID=UPI0012BD5401|nr:DUF1295 domain-containing protein [Xanthovirga aplysinae]MTI33086.1 DUF1295 domain-containing protein [Xanthovirga aplysinae]
MQYLYHYLLTGWISLALILFPLLLKIKVPYGRHTHSGWGRMIDNRKAWLIMEIPALLIFPFLALSGPQQKTPLLWLILILWVVHYGNRVFIFPFRLRTQGKKMPLLILLMGIFFNGINGFFNGYFLGYLSTPLIKEEILSYHVLIGLSVFFVGMIINHVSDQHLISLRQGKETGYKIPKGWLFEYVSCPNHLGEIIEWWGFFLICFSLPAFSFALWSMVNLIPRTLDHHRWYKNNFSDYPANRKAVIPFLW